MLKTQIKEKSTAILPVKDIEKWIKTEYSKIGEITTFKTHLLKGEFQDIYIEIKTKKHGFETITPYRFQDKQIVEIANKIFEERELLTQIENNGIEYPFKYGNPIITEHIDGDSSESMDYGSYTFKGIMFRWKEV
jgi:hypothetical protein